MEILKTDRLFFRTWKFNDLENAVSLWGNPLVMTFIGKGELSLEEVKAKLESEISCYEKNGVQYWTIFQESDSAFVGCCGLKPWVHSSAGGLELGFHLIPSAWGKGYAQESARATIQLATSRGISHLMAGHHPQNENSKKVLEKLGFTFVQDVLFPPTGLMHPSYKLLLQ